MLIEEVEPTGEEASPDLTSEISSIFEGGTATLSYSRTLQVHTDSLSAAKPLDPQNGVAPKAEVVSLFTIKELEWFASNSYNLAVSRFADWTPTHVITLLGASSTVGLPSHISTGFNYLT